MNMCLEDKTPIQIILKLTGNDCNLNCTYCYEKRRQYGNSNYMTLSTVEQLLHLLDDREISIQLHGGDPPLITLTTFEKFQTAVEKLTTRIGK